MKSLTILFISLILTACGSTKLSKKEEESLIHYNYGSKALMDKNLPVAIKSLKMAVELNPKDSKSLNNLGLAYMIKKELPLAEQTFKRAIEVDDKNLDPQSNLANLYMNTNRLNEAEEIYLTISKDLTYTQQFRIFYNLGVLSEKRGQLDQAITYYKRSIDDNDSFCLAKLDLGRAYYTQDKKDLAFETFKEGIKGVCYNNPASIYELAKMQQELNHFEAAKNNFTEILGRFPNSEYSSLAKRKLMQLNEEKNDHYGELLDNSTQNERLMNEESKPKYLTPEF